MIVVIASYKELSLDRQGFVLVGDQTAVANFYDEHDVRTVYYPGVERLIKRATGGSQGRGVRP